MSNRNSALSKSYTKTSSKSSNTFSSSVKEIMENMPDNLNTKKDIDELKEDKTTAKQPAVKRGRKKEKEKGVDEEGNEIEVVKKPVSNYMKFIEDHRHRIKAVNSGLSPQDLFKVVSELWRIYKEFVIENKEVGDDKLAELWELHLKELLEKRKS